MLSLKDKREEAKSEECLEELGCLLKDLGHSVEIVELRPVIGQALYEIKKR